MLGMISRVIATSLLTLIPPKKIKQSLFISIFIQIAGYYMMSLAHLKHDLSNFLFYSGSIFFGLGRGTMTFPYLLLVRFFNQPTDKFAVNLWVALSFGGNLWGFEL